MKFEAGEAPLEMERKEGILEIRNYQRALKMGEEKLKTIPFSLNLLKQLHAVLLDSVRGRNMARGEFRKIANMLGKLKTAGILKVVRQGSGRRPQILALSELINLSEGRTVI